MNTSEELKTDFEMALRASPGDQDIKLIADTLNISNHVIRDHCNQLSSQVNGRGLASMWHRVNSSGLYIIKYYAM